MDDPLSPVRTPAVDAALAVLLVASLGAPLLLAAVALGAQLHPLVGLVLAVAAGIAGAVALYRRVRTAERAPFVTAAEGVILGVLPLWGLAYSHFLAQPSCVVDGCGGETEVMRPFAEPEVFGLIALHALSALAYAVSRRRPEALRPATEALIHAALVAGLLTHLVVGVHVARWLGAALLLPPLFLPCLAPLLTVGLYAVELHGRLVRRGVEADAPAGAIAPDSPYREGPAQVPLPPPARVHRAGLLRALALGPALLGVHAVIHALWLGRADGALSVFTRTCGHVLSSLPIEVTRGDCHYLCTVAARGHAWLVRPERLGRRGGVTIVVNRQLALANAFEDLLHERWPRFGRLARRAYDRVGLPVSRYLRRPWLADLVYLAMKPAEWAFWAVLLLLDRGDPEARIARMYPFR